MGQITGTEGLCHRPSGPTLLSPPSGMSFRIPRDRHVWKCLVRFDHFTWVSRVPHRADELSRGSAGLGVEGAWAVTCTAHVERASGCSRLQPASHVPLTGSCECGRLISGEGSFPVTSRVDLSADSTFLTEPRASGDSRQGTVWAGVRVKGAHESVTLQSGPHTSLGGREATEASARGNWCDGFVLCPANPTGVVPTV